MSLTFSATRRTFLLTSAAVAALPVRAVAPSESSESAFWLGKPAERWLQAFPVGNGRIGVMQFGDPSRERLHLSESTLWSGAPSRNNLKPGGRAQLDAIRDLFFQGRYDEADALCEKHLTGKTDQFGTSLPLGYLDLDLGSGGWVSDYRRSLDLEKGIARVRYRQGGVLFERTLFVSNPDQIAVLHLQASRPGALRGRIGFGSPKLPGTVSAETSNQLRYAGQALEMVHSDGHHGVRFESLVRVLTEGGTVSPEGDALRLEKADSATVLIAIATDFEAEAPGPRVDAMMERAVRRGYQALHDAHVTDHRRLFRRVSIDLGGSPERAAQPLDERRRQVAKGQDDPALAALFFQFGRYLTIAGSRENSPLPLALQGIWNDGKAAAMGWADDFHLDMNTQQNYWICEAGNLGECHRPLWRLLETMRQTGQTTARELYGAPGWVAHVVTDPWGFTAPGWGNGWGIFVTGGVWLALDLWDHYRFNPDPAFLRDTAYPILIDAARFFLSYMVRHPRHGWLVTGPSISPENAYRSPQTGQSCSNSMGPTCDIVLVRALFTACIAIGDILGTDADLRQHMRDALTQLPPLQIGRHGQLQEWLEDFEEAQPNHRHTSHLIALYPEAQIDPDRTPALAAAAKVTLDRRLAQPDWEDTEWSRANLINFHARLRDGERANVHLNGLIGQDCDDSLLSYSRGGIAGAEDNIYSFDGNAGGAAGIAEMLLQSQGEEILLLPALPKAWRDGSVCGLKARGGLEIALRWRGGRLTEVGLRASRSARFSLRYGQVRSGIDLKAGQSVTVTPEHWT